MGEPKEGPAPALQVHLEERKPNPNRSRKIEQGE
jgi:hypothetical protein